jgi:hypothetical protein
VRFLALEGPRVVKELLLDEIHVPFSTSEEGELDLTQGRGTLAAAHHSCGRRDGTRDRSHLCSIA